MKVANKIFLTSCLSLGIAYAIPPSGISGGRYGYTGGYNQGYGQSAQQPSLRKTSSEILLYDIGLGLSYYRYTEPGVMHISGPMFNLFASLGYVRDLFRFQMDLTYDTHVGANAYDGGIQDGHGNTTPYKTKSTDWYISGAAKFGLTLFDKKEIFFVYTGLGYRFLRNHLEDKPGIKASYYRYQGYLYLPIGMSGEIPVNPQLSLISALEYRILLFGHNTSTLTDVGYNKDVFFKQSIGYGGRLSMGVRYYILPTYSIKINAYWDFWSIDASDIVSATSADGTVGNFVEPKNHTNVFGVTFGFSF